MDIDNHYDNYIIAKAGRLEELKELIAELEERIQQLMERIGNE